MRQSLGKVGLKVVIESTDAAGWTQRLANWDYEMLVSYLTQYGDPALGVARTYISSNIKKGVPYTNTSGYSNPKVDELLNTAGGLLDPTKRKAYYATFEKIVTDELPIVFINQVPYHTASSKKLANVPTTIWGPLSPYDEVYFK